jgi:hypothetical protein
VDWPAYDLAVLRSPWDYSRRRDEFIGWTQKVPHLANPAAVAAWNTDKRYLRDLVAAGVPVVDTGWVEPADDWAPGPAGEYVIKPAISAGSADTGRYDLADPEHRRLATAHVTRLRSAGRLTMIQPYLSAVDTAGETGLMFVRDHSTGRLEFSHAIRKGPMLTGPHLGVNEGLYVDEEIGARAPAAAELDVARRALAAVPGGPDQLLYARVDLIPAADGAPVLVELELTEPSLFLATAPGAPQRYAAAIAATAAPA